VPLGIQPRILARVLGQEHFENGLAARLLLTMPPRRAKKWSDDVIAVELESQLEAVFTHLSHLVFQPAGPDEPEPYP